MSAVSDSWESDEAYFARRQEEAETVGSDVRFLLDGLGVADLRELAMLVSAGRAWNAEQPP